MSHYVDSSAVDASASSTVYKYGKKYAYYVLFLLSFLMLFDILDRMIVSSMAQSLKQHFGLSDGQFGSLMGIINVAIAVLAFPSAVMVDRWSRKKMVGIMGLIWGLSSLGCAFAPSFAVLLFLRFMVGAGEAGYMPAANPILLDAFPSTKHNTVLGMLQAAGPLGSVLGILLGGIIADKWGWQHAFGVVAIPGILVAFLAFFLKEPVRAAVTNVNVSTGKSEKVALSKIIKKLFKTRTLVCIFFSMAMSLIFTSCLMTWMPSYFIRGYGMAQKNAGMLAAGVMAIMAVGAVLGGMVSDKLARKNSAAPLYCAAIYAACNSLFFLAAFALAPKDLVIPLMLVGALFTMAVNGPAFGAVMHACHPGVRATAIGLLVVVQNIFGMAIGAGLSGFLSDFYRGLFLEGKIGNLVELQAQGLAEAAINAASLLYGLRLSLITLGVTPLIGAALFFLAARAFKNDCAGASCFE